MNKKVSLILAIFIAFVGILMVSILGLLPEDLRPNVKMQELYFDITPNSKGSKVIEKNFKGVNVSRPQGTYMIFPDCAEWLKEHDKTLDELVKMGWDVGVAWQNGRTHGGDKHIRINLALPFSRVKEAFDRLDKYVFNA